MLSQLEFEKVLPHVPVSCEVRWDQLELEPQTLWGLWGSSRSTVTPRSRTKTAWGHVNLCACLHSEKEEGSLHPDSPTIRGPLTRPADAFLLLGESRPLGLAAGPGPPSGPTPTQAVRRAPGDGVLLPQERGPGRGRAAGPLLGRLLIPTGWLQKWSPTVEGKWALCSEYLNVEEEGQVTPGEIWPLTEGVPSSIFFLGKTQKKKELLWFEEVQNKRAIHPFQFQSSDLYVRIYFILFLSLGLPRNLAIVNKKVASGPAPTTYNEGKKHIHIEKLMFSVFNFSLDYQSIT